MSLFITGGCGFIGTNLIRKIKDKHEIVCFDNLSTGNKEDIPSGQIKLIEGDIKDFEHVRKSMHHCEAVIHLAADTTVIESINNPRFNMEENVVGTFNIFEAARENKIKKVIFASTGGAILGDVEPPVHEGIVPKPISPYGASKLCCEAYASAFAGSYDINSIGLRFANVYGPFSYHKGSVVAKFFKKILKNEPLTVYGDGKQTRDYVYTNDLVTAIENALYKEIIGFEAFHLGSGVETNVLELIEIIKTITGKEQYPIQFKPTRQGEVLRNYTDISKAKKMLDFSPKNDLRKGLEETWKWFTENKEKITNYAKEGQLKN